MALEFTNRVGFVAASSGTGSFVVNSTLTGLAEPTDAIPTMVDGGTYNYFAQSSDLSQWCYGTGVWTTGTSTLTRNDENSVNGTTPYSFSAAPNVIIGGPLAQNQMTPQAVTATVTPSATILYKLIPPLYYQFGSGAAQRVNGPCIMLNDSEALLPAATTAYDADIAGIDGSVSISSYGVTSVEFTPLVFVNGGFNISSNTSLATLDIAALVAVTGTINLTGNASLTGISLPALVYIGGDFEGGNGTLATSLDVGALVTVGGAFNYNDSTADLVTLDVGALQTVGGQLNISGHGLTALDISSVLHIGDQFYGGDSAALETIDISGLLSLNGNFNASGCALTQAGVDAILVRLAAMDGTAGTTSYDNWTVDLSGGTSASPSGTGATAKTTLEGRGNTVTVN